MVHIVTDTTSCLGPQFSARYHVPIIPQVINFGTDSFLEGVELDNAGFLKRLKSSGELPKTAAPPPELFIKEFERLVPTGEPIVCIHPSAEVSGTVRSATVAAQDFPGADIRIIDTRVISSPLGTMVERAALWAAEGKDADEIVAGLQDLIARCRVYFLVSTLEYLARGGRIGGASALVGSMLQIKPILTLRDGKVDVYERDRTYKRAYARLKEIVIEQISPNGKGHLTVMHAGVPEEAGCLSQELSHIIHQPEVQIFDVPPAITTHGGPGILGVGFFAT